MLVQIRDFIHREGIASNQQIARFFNLDTEALEPMMSFWIKKNLIAICSGDNKPGSGCKSACFRCKPAKLVYYQALK